MENILMVHLRTSNKRVIKEVAAHLGLTVTQYRQLENGEAMLNRRQAIKLAGLFNVKVDYIFKSAEQLQLVISRKTAITIMKKYIETLEEKIRRKDEPESLEATSTRRRN
jgi:transcriptional regulator with XRE-family HTH domain